MQKTPNGAETRLAGTEMESYLSLSPPADERKVMMQTRSTASQVQAYSSSPVFDQVFQPTRGLFAAQERGYAQTSAKMTLMGHTILLQILFQTRSIKLQVRTRQDLSSTLIARTDMFGRWIEVD
ncbi:hypothetical protein VTL71DRAFT_14026 [Oculimacula yallundae]|uniref:Uncharacterized protein n=1 Tax=Oculimacula yallundae TaxID=86028 RepID=A0ABR4CM14_9HELO